MDLRAKQFYDRSLKASDYSERLLCLNNAFFVLYQKDFAKKASQSCGVTEKVFLDAVEYCREDSESRRVLLSSEQLDALTQELAKVFTC